MSAVQVRDVTSGTEDVRFRLTPWQRILPCTIFVVALIGQIVAWFVELASALSTAERQQFETFNAAIFAVLFILMLRTVWQSRGYGVTLTPTEAHVHGLRGRVIRWSDVRAVTRENMLASRTVVLHEANRRTRLRAPITVPLAPDRRFDEKFHTIEQWWLTHREPTDSPI